MLAFRGAHACRAEDQFELSRHRVDSTAFVAAGTTAAAEAATGARQVVETGARVRSSEADRAEGSSHAEAPLQEVEVPKVALNNFAPAVLKPIPGGARPVLIHTGDFAGSSRSPTVNAPIQKVQTGGFGDPNGLKPNENSKANAKLMAAAAGGFDMPVGPGNGNGSGGAKGIKGTVASADFGNWDCHSGKRRRSQQWQGSTDLWLRRAGNRAGKPGVQRTLDSGPATTSVEIIFKPNPAYTEEARGLKLEGEVLLEVLFGANGQLHVNRVVRGLGHGLDENAIAAANKMRFKPALRNGQPVDSTAIVHVVFQLAY